MDEQVVQETAQESTPAVTEAVEITPTDVAEEAGEENQYLLPLDEDENHDPVQQPDSTESLKPYLELSPYINSPESLQGAVADSHLLWDVINGQQPAGNMLEGIKTSNPQAWQNVVNGLAQYIQQQTGYAFVDPNALPQQENIDPVQSRLNAIEQQFRQQEEAREAQLLQYRAQQAQGALLNHLGDALKGTFLEGEEGQVLAALGQKLGGDHTKVIESIEKGDFKSIDSALKAIKREETERYNRYVKRIASQRKAVANSLPKVDNPGSTSVRKDRQFDTTTKEGRIAYMNSLL
jgi:hypothetical protein